MSFRLLCPPLCCWLEQAVQCKLEEGTSGCQHDAAPGPQGCGAPLVPEEEEEKRGGAGTPLSRCCSLFVPLTLVAVVLVLVRGEGSAAAHTEALSLSAALRYHARLSGWLAPSSGVA